ncbi:MAG: hypothetical protein PHQ27_08325, partial [Victivallales bacterium]|nr:hypothetical protein [Victivallales bacterium]
TFFSLQRGMKPEAAIPVPKAETVVDYGCRIDNFADLAAILVNLDVVVSVDTAALHLAGALGVKAYGLIHFSPDWRWELAGEQTRWYDTVTLLRQERPFDWSSCLTRLTAVLRRLAHAPDELSPLR